MLALASLILVVVAMTPSLAHALELPGKLRLAQDQYLAVQTIYYPGFTIAGIAEPLAIVSTVILLLRTPAGGLDFWLTAASLLGLVGMHAVYWLVTHPVNKFWVKGAQLGAAGAGFFSLGSAGSGSGDWRKLRDRWEYSHVARAALAAASFLALGLAISTDG